MTEFSCMPPQIPHIDGFELEMLKPSVFEDRYPEIEQASHRVIATTALGAILSVTEYVNASLYAGDEEYVNEVIKIGLHNDTRAGRVTITEVCNSKHAIEKTNFLCLSPEIASALGERFGFVGDMYKPVYCDDHSGTNKDIGAQHYGAHLAKEESEFPMACRYREHVRHDAALDDHILGMMTVDTEARRVHGARIKQNLASNPDEVVADAHAFDYLTANVGQPLFYKLTDTDWSRIAKRVDNSLLEYACKILMKGPRKFTFALSRFTDFPLPNILTTDIKDDLERIAVETQRALKGSGIPDMRHHGLSEQTKAILEMAERVAAREKQMGQVIVRELKAAQLQSSAK